MSFFNPATDCNRIMTKQCLLHFLIFAVNNTYNQLKNSPISVVVKSAGNKTSESYEDAIIDR